MSTTTAPATGTHATHTGKNHAAPVMTHRQIMLVIYGLMAGMFLASLDQTIVGTAIRTIGDDLKGLDQQAWVTTAYLITSTIATPIYGKLSDLFGRRPLYLFGITVFIAGSLMSSFSTSMIMLAAFRGFQGIGAGALMSLPLAIMGDILAPRERAKYQGFFLAVFGISSVIGPLVGGLFAGANQVLWITGWRWVFLVNVPIGIVALGMVIAFLHLPKFGEHRHPRIDWWGATAVITTLVPLLIVAEEGRTWGWGSWGSVLCYVIGGVGLVSFLLIERAMASDALIPLRLFRSRVFTTSTVLGVLVGFAMFGAMLTLPLYLQIVVGLDPTQSGFATLPMMAGVMLASIGSGQIISRTGKYRIFPVTGTAITATGYVVLTFMTIDKPLWFLMIAMFLIGLGLGQLMQTLTLATQSAVEPKDMGVATSASTFFRQIGGTLGTAVLLSVLFAVMPSNIITATANKTDLTAGLQAALDPSVANASNNKAVMKQIWDKTVVPVKAEIQAGLDEGVTKAKAGAEAAVTAKVTAGVEAEVAAGKLPASQAQAIIKEQVAAALPAAESQALDTVATKAHASVVDGKVEVDWSNASQRNYYVAKTVPTIESKLKSASSSSFSGDTSDTSFLNGADSRLTKPFMKGFNASAVTIYWVGFGVILLAFVITWFFKVPPLRKTSALQQRANDGDKLHGADAAPTEAAAESAAAVVGVDPEVEESIDDREPAVTGAAPTHSA